MATPNPTPHRSPVNRPPMIGSARRPSITPGSISPGSSSKSMLPRSSTVANLFADQTLAKLLNVRSNEEEATQSRFELMRLHTKFFMASTWGGHVYSYIFLLLSIVSCFVFILQTYYEYDANLTSRGLRVMEVLGYLELILAGMFAFDWLLELFVAEHKTEYLLRYCCV